MLVVTVLVFRAFSCGTVGAVASGCLSVIRCGAALWVCVLLGLVAQFWDALSFGNLPGVLHQVMCWCVRTFACSTRLEVGLLANMVGVALLAL
jgi:hypothetical protein